MQTMVKKRWRRTNSKQQKAVRASFILMWNIKMCVSVCTHTIFFLFRIYKDFYHAPLNVYFSSFLFYLNIDIYRKHIHIHEREKSRIQISTPYHIACFLDVCEYLYRINAGKIHRNGKFYRHFFCLSPRTHQAWWTTWISIDDK